MACLIALALVGPSVPHQVRAERASAGLHMAGETADSVGPFTDLRDGKTYPIVKIAGMTWMARNLDHAIAGSVCPRGDEQACESEGRLYPWPTAITACPAGWHLSTEDEWQRLERALGMSADDLERDRERGPGLGDRLKPGGSTGLDFPLAGWRTPDGSFRIGNGTDRAAAIWTSTRVDEDAAWHRDLSSARTGIWRSAVPLAYSLSVRCVKDARGSSPDA
jgi:uncharacterized protein (TIGR02145 family)